VGVGGAGVRVEVAAGLGGAVAVAVGTDVSVGCGVSVLVGVWVSVRVGVLEAATVWLGVRLGTAGTMVAMVAVGVLAMTGLMLLGRWSAVSVGISDGIAVLVGPGLPDTNAVSGSPSRWPTMTTRTQHNSRMLRTPPRMIYKVLRFFFLGSA